MSSYLLLLSLAWSNSEPETTSGNAESTPSNEDTKEEDSTDASSSDENAPKSIDQSSDTSPKKKTLSGPLVKVNIELVNGVTIEGDASVNSLIVWDKGMDIDISVNGEILNIGGERINSVSQMSVKETQPKPQEIKINVNSTSGKDESETFTLEPSAKGFSYHNPAASRYLYAPSSISMKKGESYLSQKSLLFTSGAVAITDNVTVLGGAVTLNPFFLSIVGGKYSYEYSPTLRFSVGGEVFFSTWGAFESLANVAYVGATYGDEDTNFSFNVGAGDVLGQAGFPITLCASHRFSDRYALMTENWLLLQVNQQYSWNGESISLVDSSMTADIAIISVAIRMMGRSTRWFSQQEYYAKSRYGSRIRLNPNASFDYGLIYLVSDGLSAPVGPIPWIDWAWKF